MTGELRQLADAQVALQLGRRAHEAEERVGTSARLHGEDVRVMCAVGVACVAPRVYLVCNPERRRSARVWWAKWCDHVSPGKRVY